MGAQQWAVSLRYAGPGERPGNRRHPSPEDFCRRTVVGPAGVHTVEAVFDLLGVSAEVRQRIHDTAIVRDFTGGRLIPDLPYPHRATGGYYVSYEPGAQFVEWDIEFTFVSSFIADDRPSGVGWGEGDHA